jgi:hypothetical protein
MSFVTTGLRGVAAHAAQRHAGDARNANCGQMRESSVADIPLGENTQRHLCRRSQV